MADVVSLIDDDDEDDYEMDLELAIAASLAPSAPALRNTGSSCDGQSDGAIPTIAPDDDVQLQQALALSLETYQSEQQQQQQNMQLAGEDVFLQSRKRSCSGAADSDSRGHLQAGVEEAAASLKRLRSCQVQGQSPSVNAAAALVALVAAARNEVASSCSPVLLSAAAMQQQGTLLPTAPCAHPPPDAAHIKQQQQQQQPGFADGLGRSGSVQDVHALTTQHSDDPADKCFNDSLEDTAAASDVSNTSEASGAGLGGQQGNSKPQPVTRAAGSGSVHPGGAQAARGSSPDHSSSSDASVGRLHYLGQSVWVNSPGYAACFSGRVIAVDAGPNCSAAGPTYTVEVTGAAVKYVEASAGQLQPRLAHGDWVWCKPDQASPSQYSHTSCWLQHYHQQQHQQPGISSSGQYLQQQQQPSAMSAPTVLPSGWVRGQVLSALIMQGTAVVEVALPAQCCVIWFPVNQVQPVREIGECSSSAEARGQQTPAAAAAAALLAAGCAKTASQAAPGPAGTADTATAAVSAELDGSSGDAAVVPGALRNSIVERQQQQQQQQAQRRGLPEACVGASDQLQSNCMQPAGAAIEQEALAAVSFGQVTAADPAGPATGGPHQQNPQLQPITTTEALRRLGSSLPPAAAASGLEPPHRRTDSAEGGLGAGDQREGASGGRGLGGSNCHPEEVGDSCDAGQLARSACCCSGSGASGSDRLLLHHDQRCRVLGQCCQGLGERAV